VCERERARERERASERARERERESERERARESERERERVVYSSALFFSFFASHASQTLHDRKFPKKSPKK
jgi:hypothetical protein